MKIGVTVLGYIGDLLILSSARGLITWRDPEHQYAAGTAGDIVLAEATTETATRRIRGTAQCGNLVRIGAGSDDPFTFVAPPGLRFPEFIALELDLEPVETSEGAPDDTCPRCGCPDVTRETVRQACRWV